MVIFRNLNIFECNVKRRERERGRVGGQWKETV